MGTSIGAATDWLIANFTPAVAAVNPFVLVGDSVPLMDAASYVVVGRSLPDDPLAPSGTQIITAIGQNKVDEEYVIPCFVVAAVAGPSQKPSRDAVIALYDACAHVVTVDRTLGGTLSKWAEIVNIRVVAANAKDTDKAGALCSTWIGFDVQCKNHYLA
jgi:hypothetical protein